MIFPYKNLLLDKKIYVLLHIFAKNYTKTPHFSLKNPIFALPKPIKNNTHMKKIILIVLIVVVAVLALTCPSKEAHKAKIQETITSLVDDEINERVDDPVVSKIASLGSVFAGRLTGTILESKLQVTNYFLFSVGKIHFQGEDRVISFGIFNQVKTFDKEDVKNVVNTYLDSKKESVKNKGLK